MSSSKQIYLYEFDFMQKLGVYYEVERSEA
jgi:hypothetical protein